MKEIILFCILFTANIIAQDVNFHIPDSTLKVEPTPEQLELWNKFNNSQSNSLEIRWDYSTGSVASILGKPFKIKEDSPQKIAETFFLEYSKIFRMKLE